MRVRGKFGYRLAFSPYSTLYFDHEESVIKGAADHNVRTGLVTTFPGAQ